MIYLFNLISNYCYEKAGNHDYSKMPNEILEIIIGNMDLNSLKNLNQANQKLSLLTDNCCEYAQTKKIQNFAKGIIAEFEPNIKISLYHQGPNLNSSIVADTIANAKCSGKLVNEEKKFIIEYQANVIAIPVESHNSKNFRSLFSGYQCRFTDSAKIILKSNDNELARAALIAQGQINKLLEINSTKAKNLNTTLIRRNK